MFYKPNQQSVLFSISVPLCVSSEIFPGRKQSVKQKRAGVLKLLGILHVDVRLK